MDTKQMKQATKEEYETVLTKANDLLITAEYEKKDGKKYHVSDVFHSSSLGLYYRKDLLQEQQVT